MLNSCHPELMSVFANTRLPSDLLYALLETVLKAWPSCEIDDDGETLPLFWWKVAAAHEGVDLDEAYRTYKGLCLLTDQVELLALHGVADGFPSFGFCTVIDFQSLSAFQDRDLHVIRTTVGRSLVALRLSKTRFSDVSCPRKRSAPTDALVTDRSQDYADGR